jgi:hypothetical protein
MDALSSIDSMTWTIIAAATVICIATLFSTAIKFLLKLAVIAVMLGVVAYFLVQAGIIRLP